MSPYAGFWRRFVAYVIDGILISIPFTAITVATGLGGFPALQNTTDIGATSATTTAVAGGDAVFGLVRFMVGWLYWALMESSSYQATVGKMVMGIKVTDVYGHRISFGRATGRYFGKIISGLICLIGFIMAGFTERKQALHDIMASTLVVKRDSIPGMPPTYPPPPYLPSGS